MPPKLSSPPDPRSPVYRALRDKINFALHVGVFAAVNSGVAFFARFYNAEWPWQGWLLGLWALALAAHGIYVFGIARYSET
ncbi:MAG: 2TM domain-containing protein [Aphanocapsa lilacina HA4352-LM1]|jgi:hypothetical protein|nr:2TM domain-containing protein [Aphanocapsa lilacina HA4352-LM1]